MEILSSQEKTEQTVTGKDKHGDLLIREVWARGTDSILLDVHLTDTDAKSYSKLAPAKVLASQEKEKKWKCLEACLERYGHFTPFVSSVDGMMLGRDAKEPLPIIYYSCQEAGQQMEEVLFTSMQICQCS